MTYEEIEANRAAFERVHTPRIEAALIEQGEALAAAVEDERFPLADVLEEVPIGIYLEELWSGVIVRFAGLAAADVASLKADDPDLWQEDVQAFIAQWGGELISLIDQTTLAIVREVLAEGIEEGWTTQRIAGELREEWPGISRIRADRIVRTETITGSNYGSFEGAKRTAEDAGLTLKKVWLATPDDRTRDTHAAADGQTVDLDKPFTVGGHPAMYPGDPDLPAEERANCRCSLFYEPAAKSWTERRNEEIKAAYPPLRDRYGQYAAMLELGEAHGLSYGHVKRIIYSTAA